MSTRIYIRGQATPFGQFDASPSWVEYSSPVTQPWRYVQISLGNPAPTGVVPIEGFGKNVTGGTGYPTYTVTNPAATGSGTFDAIAGTHCTNKIIQFANGMTSFATTGTINLFKNVTVDGLANGNNGVVHNGKQYDANTIQTKSESGGGGGGNIIVRGIKFRGNRDNPGGRADSDGCSIEGTNVSGTPDLVNGVLYERCSFQQISDGAIDICRGNPIQNITVQGCLFTECYLPMLIKYNTTHNISIHHNVFAACGERPQIRGNHTLVDWVNNIDMRNHYYSPTNVWPADYYIASPTYGGTSGVDPYGLRIHCAALIGSPNDQASAAGNAYVNFRGNCYLGDVCHLQLITDTGADESGVYWDPHGTSANNNYFGIHTATPIRFNRTYIGESWNWVYTPNCPAASPNTIPAGFEITRHAIGDLAALLPQIGCPLRTETDQYHLDTVQAALEAIP